MSKLSEGPDDLTRSLNNMKAMTFNFMPEPSDAGSENRVVTSRTRGNTQEDDERRLRVQTKGQLTERPDETKEVQ